MGGIFDWYFFVVVVTLAIVNYASLLPPPLDINAIYFCSTDNQNYLWIEPSIL